MSVTSFHLPTRIQYGCGAAKTVGKEASTLGGKHVLLVTDKGVVTSGMADLVCQALKEADIAVTIFDEVIGNPKGRTVAKGEQAFRDAKADLLVALGGGSSIDTAKAIGVVVAHGGRIEEFGTGERKFTNPIAPLIAIPTTAGTGSEVSSGSVITDEERAVKLALGNPLMCARVAILDAEMTLSMPPAVTAATGIDAMIHGIERYTNRNARPHTDALALSAVEYGARWLRPAYANGSDLEARDGMLSSSLMGGMARTGVGVVHAISHTLGAFYDLPHGVCCALLLPAAMEFNLHANPPKFARLAEALGEVTTGLSTVAAARLVPNSVRQLMQDINLPMTLTEVGIPEADIPRIAETTLKDYKGLAADNPRTLTAADIEALLHASL